MTEAVIENVWVEEVAPVGAATEQRAIKPPTTVPNSWPAERQPRLDAPGSGSLCRCWRCSGAMISLMERGPLDRILARHLLRMTEAERNEWLGQWYQVPNHGPDDIRALEAWIAIEQRKRIPEPSYSPRRAG